MTDWQKEIAEEFCREICGSMHDCVEGLSCFMVRADIKIIQREIKKAVIEYHDIVSDWEGHEYIEILIPILKDRGIE